MLSELTVKEYATLKDVSEKTVHNWIEKGRLQCKYKNIKGRNVKVILVNDNELLRNYNENYSEPKSAFQRSSMNEFQNQEQAYEEAEIIDETSTEKNYNVISMENNTFEELINSIKELANARAQSDKESIENYKEQFFEAKSEIKQLQERLLNLKDDLTIEKLKSAQFETEVKIQSLRIEEFENKINNLETNNKILKEQLEQKLKQETENTKQTSFWTNKL